MRDVNRIDDLLDTLKTYWKKYPDLRFGQLVYDIVAEAGYKDIFFIEDDTFKDALIRFFKSIEK